MKSGLEKAAATPVGAATLSLLTFVLVFMLLGNSVPMTLAAFVVAALGLVILIRPEYGIHVLVLQSVVAFFQYFEMPRIGPLSIPLALAGILMLAFVVQLSFFRKRLYLNFAENWLLFGYALLVVASMGFADHLGPENLIEFRRLFLIGILVYFLATNLIEAPAAFMRLLWVLVLSDVILIVSGMLNYMGYLEPAGMDADRLQGRTVGIIGNPNALAYTLIGLFPFTLVMAFQVSRPWLRRSLLVAAAGTLFVILNTLSRGGFIALMCVILLMTFRLSRDRRLVALLLLLAGVIYLILPAALFDRFEEIRSLQGNSRYELTVIGVEMALDNPILGVGYANFRRYFPRYDVVHRGGTTAPHNLYTSIASQTGIPSLVLFLVVITLSWRRLNRIRRATRHGPDGRFMLLITTALQANLLNVLVFGVTSHVEHEYLNFVVLALIMILARLYSSPDGAPEAPRFPAAAGSRRVLAGGLR